MDIEKAIFIVKTEAGPREWTVERHPPRDSPLIEKEALMVAPTTP
jgi:hypothetical protein